MKNLLLILLFAMTFPIMAQDPPDISLVFYLEEKSPNGTVVGAVTGTDPNGDPLVYSIVSGNGSGAFSINSTTGDILVADQAQLIFEQNPTFELGIEADDLNGGIITVQVVINLIDIPLGFDSSEEVLTFYPNPVTELLTVDLKEMRNVEIFLHSLSGTLIPIRPVLTADSKIEIDFTAINKGVYLLQIGNGKEYFSRRIVVR